MRNMLSDSQRVLLTEYLETRLSGKSMKEGLSIVFDVTYFCNLHCKGCAVNAKLHEHKNIDNEKLELGTSDVLKILEKIHRYVESKSINPFFINLGGGEPFLRKDFKYIVKRSAELFGAESVAVDTNGTFLTIQDALEISDSISCLGVSVDGLEAYHNDWRGTKKVANPYRQAMAFIEAAVKQKEIKKILEVSSVATKKNLSDLPNLIQILNEKGVPYYSVHRTFPVGRMAVFHESIPNCEEYLWLALEIARADKELEIDCHIHHSLESIYGSIFLDRNTYIADKVVGNPDSRSSFGIDPKGNIYFDPWCMVKPWNDLFGGNILDNSFDFNALVSGKGVGMLGIAKQYSLKSVRCEGCQLNCSGGSRIAASAEHLYSSGRRSLSDLLIGLSKVDPACPLEKS